MSGSGQPQLQKGFVIRKLAGNNGQLAGAHPEMLERMGIAGYTVVGESSDVMTMLKAEAAITDASDATPATTPLKSPGGLGISPVAGSAQNHSGVPNAQTHLALAKCKTGGSILGVAPAVGRPVVGSDSVDVDEIVKENERLKKALSEKEAEVAALQRLLLQTVSMSAK